MSEQNHQTLIHLAVDLDEGTPLAQNIIAEFGRAGTLQAISSVYKRFLGPSRLDLNAQIEVVLYFSTALAVDELLWHFKDLTKDNKSRMTLLAYDDLVVLSPQLTLPHPSLHTDNLVVRCASEAWGSFEHPIIQKSLTEIATNTQSPISAEFFLQGKSLVDF